MTSPDPRSSLEEALRTAIDSFTGRRRIQISEDDIDELAKELEAVAADTDTDALLRSAILFGPDVEFPNLPTGPRLTGPDVLEAVAHYMDRQDDRAEVEAGMYSGFRANRDVQAHLREWAKVMREALSTVTDEGLDAARLDAAMAAAGIHVDLRGVERPAGCESCRKGVARIATEYRRLSQSRPPLSEPS